MDVSELPVSKSGGPRVDVDALEAELENSRLDASTTAGQLADAQRDALKLREQVAALTAAAETNQAVLVVTTRELGKWKAMYALAVLPVAADDLRQRGDVYRARALALVRLVRRWRERDWHALEQGQYWYNNYSDLMDNRTLPAEARLAAQQGAHRDALESLRGRVSYARQHLLSPEFSAYDFLAGLDEFLARSAGQAPTGGETETR